MNTPACFSSQHQFAQWRAAAELSTGNKEYKFRLRDNYCMDCTPEYRAAMASCGKCEHPKVTFDVDRDGFVRGVRPAEREVA
ncbi:MAG: hypothetical protein FWD62_05345 [Betaproteobacteria bacterium]|nr:hypothetical protein [Betaproteobacteria bacterium]